MTPPWQEFPKIKRYSIGWRMGDGEDYICKWSDWIKTLDESQKLEYFHQYKPHNLSWLDYVVFAFGYDMDKNSPFDIQSQDHARQKLSDPTWFIGIRWLAENDLCDFEAFSAWLIAEFA